ncbi:GntR family transcriptional regulator [Roseovarius sp. A21]|uniref:GntR family transcriptional regulator n=1 Tax=Roseovarius bejariae TaxID=2576383 RepID=A0A844CX91_9RHOB|nr:GntR family transcriptional regulator [Roseovarius bejariae]MRU16719.1 GntR family transcriptional regulator [Roseovarius bejariae]
MVKDSGSRQEPEPRERPNVKKNLSDRAYNALRDALMRGHLEPGNQLPLRPTSARFGISPTPMREALTRLVVERALTLNDRGTVIVPDLTKAELLEIRDIRKDLEGRCAAQAAQIAHEDEKQALDDLNRQFMQSLKHGNYREAVDLNTQFHLQLAKMAKLPLTYEIIEGLWVRCGPILTHLYDSGLPTNWASHPHQRILDALRNNDPASASDAIYHDIEDGGRGLLNYVSQ